MTTWLLITQFGKLHHYLPWCDQPCIFLVSIWRMFFSKIKCVHCINWIFKCSKNSLTKCNQSTVKTLSWTQRALITNNLVSDSTHFIYPENVVQKLNFPKSLSQDPSKPWFIAMKLHSFKFYRKYPNKPIACEGGLLVYGHLVYWMQFGLIDGCKGIPFVMPMFWVRTFILYCIDDSFNV